MCRTLGSNSGPLACQANSLPIELPRPVTSVSRYRYKALLKYKNDIIFCSYKEMSVAQFWEKKQFKKTEFHFILVFRTAMISCIIDMIFIRYVQYGFCHELLILCMDLIRSAMTCLVLCINMIRSAMSCLVLCMDLIRSAMSCLVLCMDLIRSAMNCLVLCIDLIRSAMSCLVLCMG